MERVEAYHILAAMWNDANAEQREALDIATRDVEFVDLMPGYFEPVKHGRWEPHYEVVDGDIRISESKRVCSVCKDIWESSSVLPYCPHCGAKMEVDHATD